MPLVAITFVPAGATVWVEAGTTVLDAAREAGVELDATCAGRGTCGTCAVRVLSGKLDASGPTERAALTGAGDDVRLACLARVVSQVTVRPLVPVMLPGADEDGAVSNEPADGPPLAAGVDLGTTSVAAVVVDPGTGREVGRATVRNRQRSFGADVLSRLSAARDGHGEALRNRAAESVAEALDAAGGAAVRRIESLVIAGNSAMEALFAGADVMPLSVYPFTVPPFDRHPEVPGALAGALSDSVRITLVEPVAGFAGGDLVAGMLAAGFDGAEETRLLVDVGTNAEVALVAGGRLWVTSAAAGPAFEGEGISHGGIAAPGAVGSMKITGGGEVALNTIGGGEPTWFSGAGLLSALAELVRAGQVGADGALKREGPLADRIQVDEDGVLGVSLGAPGGELALTQLDIRALQLAKAAVRVAVESVVGTAGIGAATIDAVTVTGAFGAAIAPTDLVDLGIVPVEVAGRITCAENAALAGAVMLAMDAEAERTVERLAGDAEHIDLAARPGFNDALMTAVSLEPYHA